MMRGPDFLLVGAAKAGTSSVASYLNQHPEIFLSPLKEPNYFALRKDDPLPAGPAPEYVLQKLLYNWSELEEDAYYGLFQGAQPAQVAGEASVRYLYFPGAPAKIHAANPEARIIAILREPVSRMFSHYNMNVQQHLEPLSFEEALDAEAERIEAGWGWDWHYAAVSRYAEQVERYFNLFGRDRVAVFFYEDLARDPQGILEAIYAHLGVSPGFRPDMSRRGKVPYRARFPRLDKALTWPHPARDAIFGPLRPRADAALERVARLFRGPAPRFAPELRVRHAERFRESNERLADLLEVALPW